MLQPASTGRDHASPMTPDTRSPLPEDTLRQPDAVPAGGLGLLACALLTPGASDAASILLGLPADPAPRGAPARPWRPWRSAP